MGNEILLRVPPPLPAGAYHWLLQLCVGLLLSFEGREDPPDPMFPHLVARIRKTLEENYPASLKSRHQLEELLDCMEEWYSHPEIRLIASDHRKWPIQ